MRRFGEEQSVTMSDDDDVNYIDIGGGYDYGRGGYGYYDYGIDDYHDDYDDNDHYDFDYDDYDHVQDDCIIKEGRKSEEDGSYLFEHHEHQRHLVAELNRQRTAREFLDMVVEVEGTQFPCHRAVLTTTPYFKTMLSPNFAESNSNVVPLHGIDSSSFSKILDFVYTGEIRISEGDVQNILETAHMLQFDKIVHYCQQVIQENISPSNCLGVMNLADVYGISGLKKKARDKAVSNFSEACQHEDFPILDISDILDLLTDEDLQVTNEDDVVNSVIRWLDMNPESSKTAMCTILPEIRLSRVRVSALQKLESHPLVQESEEWLAKIAAAKEEHLTGVPQLLAAGTKEDDANSTSRRGVSDDLAIIVGGWKAVNEQTSGGNSAQEMPLQSLICVNQDSRQCYHIANLPTPVSGYMSVASAGRHLYLTGGRVSPMVGQGPHPPPSRQAFLYDFPTDTWKKLPAIPRGRAGHQSAIVDGILYLVGGETDEATPGLSMDCYNSQEEAWLKPPTPPSIATSSGLTVTACRGKLVLIQVDNDKRSQTFRWGTYRRNVELKKLCVHAFDMKGDHWVYSDILVRLTLKDTDPVLLATVVDGKVYFSIVDEEAENNVYSYDVNANALKKEAGFVGNFLNITRRSNNDCIDTLTKYTYDYKRIGLCKQTCNTRQETPFPFALFGHISLETRKRSVGWYCRDLKKLETEEGQDGTV
ncbi:KLHL24 [Branchiostoma lanceolatum]|uniref:KLHL24 protein n=1 Tax=Branchiostoma lanceolatum TaxID=7740 RepID=A0A8K0A0I5_BRALA|nr:KLHL24 [Branchiostoma lanceolatum]